MIRKGMAYLRGAALSVIGNECLFLFSSFFVTSILTMGPLTWYRSAVDMTDRYILIPWGLILCVLRVERGSRKLDAPVRWDLNVLFLLALWIIVPFAIRFGITFNNIGSWHGFAVAYFGIYASVSERDAKMRGQMLDLSASLFALLSFALGAMALYCAATAQVLFVGVGEFGFGVAKDGMLRMGIHHNSTGMIAMLCTLMCMLGVCRRKNLLLKLVHLIPAVMMGLVTVLSQSRTSRYSLLAAAAAGCYAVIACGTWNKRAVVRHVSGVLAGAVLLAGGYMAASGLTDAALEHYAYTRAGVQKQDEAQAADHAAPDEPARAEEPEKEEEKKETEVKVKKARGAGDASFTGRTLIWKNLIEIWKDNPWHFLIGQGVGRTGSRVVEDTLLEEEGAATMHNTYLQFTADFGLIGFAMLAAFLCMLVCPSLRVFFAHGAAARPGDRILCMIVVASLMTGMMESDPFGSMSACNMLLLFALAQIVGRDRDMRALV